MRKKEEKYKNMFKTMEKSSYLLEKKKQDWLDKQLGNEDRRRQRELEELEKQ
jgi:hypothetical protein